jgi:hypothetical protein
MRVRSAYHLLQVLQGQVGVELGAGDLGMPQDGLDVPQVRLVAEQMRGHGVAETVRADAFPHTAGLGCLLSLIHCRCLIRVQQILHRFVWGFLD